MHWASCSAACARSREAFRAIPHCGGPRVPSNPTHPCRFSREHSGDYRFGFGGRSLGEAWGMAPALALVPPPSRAPSQNRLASWHAVRAPRTARPTAVRPS
eukprot:scaffold2486_cov114-Isochrysis_galbana.AAC.2